jgi:VCBS repeat-containing protein
MVVYGRIVAAGTPTEPIRMLAVGEHRWGGVFLDHSLEDNVFSYLEINDAESINGSIGARNSVLTIDHVTFSGSARRFVYVENSSATIRNSIFPDRFGPGEFPSADDDNDVEDIKGSGIMDGGQMIIEGNTFGTNEGHNDIIDFSGPMLPGPILQVLNNTFMGTADEMLDLGGDAYVEGNVFMHARRDQYNTSAGHTNAISTGDGVPGGTIYVVRNVFYDIEHVIDLEDDHMAVLEHNTIVGITPDGDDPGNGTPQEYSAVNLVIVDRNQPGRGAHLDGNILFDVPERVFGLPDTTITGAAGALSDLVVSNTLLPTDRCGDVIGQRSGTIMDLGTNILCGDPLLVDSTSDWNLLPGSPAIGAGVHGLDLGAMVPAGATVSAWPALTNRDSATFTVDGPGVDQYRYRFDDDSWSNPISVSVPITLSGLDDGQHSVEVVGQNYAGVWQDDADAVVRAWTIDSNLPRPTASDDGYATDEDTPLVVSAAEGVLDNDQDVGSPLSAILVSSPIQGTVSLAADGSFTYTPDADANGSDTFTYRADDGLVDSDVATVTITVSAVNDPPVATGGSYDAVPNTTLNVALPGVLSNDTDIEGDGLTAELVTDVSTGQLSLNSDGSLSYDAPAAEGDYTFTYKAFDGAAYSNVVTVTFNVVDVNFPPVATDEEYDIDEDGVLTIDVATGVLDNDTDANGDSLTATLIDDVSNGTLQLDSNGSFVYTPDENFFGTDTFAYRAGDDELQSDPATVTITVDAVNDAPVAVDDVYSVNVDQTLVSSDPAGPVPVFVPNHSFESPDIPDGVFTSNADGWMSPDYPGPRLMDRNIGGGYDFYSIVDPTPDPNDDEQVAWSNGRDHFTTTAALQANATYTLTVDMGARTDISFGGAVLQLGTGSIFGESLLAGTVVADTTPVNGSGESDGWETWISTFTTGTQPAGLGEPIRIEFIGLGSQTLFDNVRLEVSQSDGGENGVLVNDTDVEGDQLTAVLVDDVDHGTLTLNSDGTFSYTPDQSFVGADTFTYRANDGALDSDLATVSINVVDVNSPPDATDDDYNLDEDGVLTVDVALGVLDNDTDANGDTLTATLVDDVSDGTLQLDSNGSFVYTPDENFFGTDTFTYQADDGDLQSDSATVTITVDAVNDAPVANNDAYSIPRDGLFQTAMITGQHAAQQVFFDDFELLPDAA